ncbi:MAG: ferric reductase-like transmembrane domain-containing protein [Pseudomonadota bacterium]
MIWLTLALCCAVPLGLALTSPLLQWRDPIYIGAGVAGILALIMLLFQPLLAAGLLPDIGPRRSRQLHRWVGAALVVSVVLHVAGLWLTSPPDVVDALIFASPTPFSAWGVIAMWALFTSALLTGLRRRMRLRLWRLLHTLCAMLVLGGTIAHALLIEGTMEPLSKLLLCLLAALALLKTVSDVRVWTRRLLRG